VYPENRDIARSACIEFESDNLEAMEQSGADGGNGE